MNSTVADRRAKRLHRFGNREAFEVAWFIPLISGATAALALGASAHAQAPFYPTQTVRMVVPFTSGGVTDHLARILADYLARVWNQSVVVENRPGLPGTTSVAKSPADGYTLLMTSNGHVIARAINKNVSFDPVGDFAGVIRVADVPFVMITSPDLPATTLAAFVTLAKAQPGKFNFSSAGVASSVFLAAETLRQAANLNLVHVPYRGSPEAVTAVLRGDVAFYFTSVLEAVELSTAGKVRALAISSATRSPHLPDVPTVAQAGVPNYSYASWFGLLAPAGTPKDIIAKVNADIANLLKQPDLVARLDKLGAVPSPNTPDEHDRLLEADAGRYTAVLRAAGIEAK